MPDTFTVIVNDNFDRGNSTVVGAPSVWQAPSVGGDWIDVQGGVGSIVSTHLHLQGDSVDGNLYLRDYIIRPAVEAVFDQQVIVTCPALFLGENADLLVQVRRQGSVWAAYMLTVAGTNSSPFMSLGAVTGGGSTSVAGPSSAITINGTQRYTVTLNAVGANPTVLSATLFNVDTSTVVATLNWSDSTAGVQTAGVCGVGVGTDTGYAPTGCTVDIDNVEYYAGGVPPPETVSEYIWPPIQTFLSESQGMGTADTTFTVSDSSLWTGSLPTRILVDNEIMKLTAISGEVFTVTRALEGTEATVHSDGAAVQTALTAGGLYAVFVAIGSS